MSRRDPSDALIGWLDQNTARLFLPTIAIAEMTSGIAKLRRTGRATDAEALDEWMASILHMYLPRILPLDAAASHTTGLLMDQARARGQAPGFADLAIAGIAAARGLTVLTRNLRHFAPLGVPACDPYAALPD